MSANLYVINKISWSDLKDLSNSKNLRIQFIEKTDSYIIYLIDNAYNVYTNILKENPRNSDQEDFEDNHKSLSNKQLFNRNILVDSSDNEVSITDDNKLMVDNTINSTCVQTTINVTTSAVAAKVGASNLENRKMLFIQCQTSNMTYGFDSSSQPFNLPNNTTISFEIGPDITLYLRRTTGSGNVVVAEFS